MAKKSHTADDETDTQIDNGAAEIPGGSAGNTGLQPIDTEQLETAQEKQAREASEEHAQPEPRGKHAHETHEEHAKPKKRKDD
jgi:hypothetical protein